MKQRRWVWSALALGLCISNVWADFEPVEKIRTTVKNYIQQNIPLDPGETLDITLNYSDIPTQLAACSHPSTQFPKESTREKINAVEMNCDEATQSWHVYIPVNVQIYSKVVVAKHTLGSNELLSESDLDYSEANVNHLYSGYFKETKEVVGQYTSQMLNVGTVITKKNIRKPQMVRKNQAVDLIVRSGSIKVIMKGLAKTDGVLNDTITAFNPSSKRILEAVVTGYNQAEVVS